MKKILSVTVILALLLLVFAGCNSINDNQISTEEAQNIALEHAGVKEADVVRLYAERDWDDGYTYYDVTFRYEDYEYEYEIDAKTGEIFKDEKEYDPVRNNRGQTPAPAAVDPTPAPEAAEQPTAPAVNERLTETAAEDIALAHAGVAREYVSFLYTEYDREDNTFEVDFRYDGFEYNYEIHADSGAILDADKEWDD